MQIDTIKVIYTYTIATIIVLGGGAILYFAPLTQDAQSATNLSLVIAGFIGAALQFVFNRETQTSTARQVERATAAGAASAPATSTPVP